MTDVNDENLTYTELKELYGDVPLTFDSWYRHSLTYQSEDGKVIVVIRPEYRDSLGNNETINSLTQHEDYNSIFVKVDGKEVYWGEGEGL